MWFIIESKLIKVDDVILLLFNNLKIPIFNVDVIVGIDTQIYVYLYINDKNISLFAFSNYQCLDLFLKIIDINGIGCKMGARLINSLGYLTLSKAILLQDSDTIAKVNGFSSKSANKLIFNLKDKISLVDDNDQYITTGKQLLTSLNFNNTLINQVLSSVKKDNKDLNQYLRDLLVQVGKFNE